MAPFIPAAATAKSVHGSATRGHDSCQDTPAGLVLTTPLSLSLYSSHWPTTCKDEQKRGGTTKRVETGPFRTDRSFTRSFVVD